MVPFNYSYNAAIVADTHFKILCFSVFFHGLFSLLHKFFFILYLNACTVIQITLIKNLVLILLDLNL